jgi:hypothetical protein
MDERSLCGVNSHHLSSVCFNCVRSDVRTDGHLRFPIVQLVTEHFLDTGLDGSN